MAKLRQRSPRIREPKYLSWLRKQSCGCGCHKPPPSDAAHLRSGSIVYDKEYPGLGAKPSDCWALPLNRACHLRQHAYGDQIGFWGARGIPDPFGRAMRYYSAYQAECPTEPTGKPPASKPRKAKPKPKASGRPRGGAGWPPKQPKIANRPFSKTKREFRT